MISKEELKDLYENDFKNTLLNLEKFRSKLIFKVLSIAILSIIIGIAVFGFDEYLNNIETQNIFLIVIIIFIISIIVLLILFFKQKKEYRKRYKEEVVRLLVIAIDRNWNYQPDLCISPYEYESSDLFRTRYDKYEGDDLISGTVEKTDFRCSELHTQYKTETTSNGKRHEKWHTIFKGLFFHADFNKHINARTYIEPDNAERLFGKLGQKLQFSSKGDLVKLENIEFEKIFAVFSSNQTEARYILTPAIMEALVNIYNTYKRKMYLSFLDSRVYCAISFKKDLFEPSIFRSGVNYYDIEMMYDLILLNKVIIHELNLNTRIWTKE